LLTLCLPFVALPLLLLGLALGVAGILVAIKRKGGGIGLPIAGSAICAILLIPPVFTVLGVGALVGVMNRATTAQRDGSTGHSKSGGNTDRPGGSISTTDLGATIERASP
jgi:hypothetical protein